MGRVGNIPRISSSLATASAAAAATASHDSVELSASRRYHGIDTVELTSTRRYHGNYRGVGDVAAAASDSVVVPVVPDFVIVRLLPFGKVWCLIRIFPRSESIAITHKTLPKDDETKTRLTMTTMTFAALIHTFRDTQVPLRGTDVVIFFTPIIRQF